MEGKIEKRLKELYQLKRELLMHVVGMSYRMQEVKKVNEEIIKLEKIISKEAHK